MPFIPRSFSRGEHRECAAKGSSYICEASQGYICSHNIYPCGVTKSVDGISVKYPTSILGDEGRVNMKLEEQCLPCRTVLQRLFDSSGHTVGVNVVGFDFTDGQESQAAKLGKEIDEGIAQQIPAKSKLLETGK